MTKLQVGNTDFLINSLIDRCPNTMMLRELVTNAIEASKKAKNKSILIRVTKWRGADKLSIWNTGPGMSFSELRNACDISSSINKIQSLDENFGIGAKVASLKANKVGMRYRSNKDGVVAEVVMGQDIDPTTRKPIYQRFDYPEQTTTNFPDVADVTANMKEENIKLDEDWTEVVLYGNSESQNTVKNPFNNSPKVPLRWIANALYQRFFKLPEGVKIIFEDGTNSRGGNRTFEPYHERIIRMSKQYKDNMRQETVNLPDGVKVHYYFDGEDTTGGHNFSYKGNVASDISFCGVVFKNEIYDWKGSNSWYVTSPKLGIPFGQRYISVTVELPEDTEVIPDQYRESIKWNDHAKERVKIEQYAQIVRDNIPSWLKEKIEQFSPKKSTSEDIKDKLRELLNNLNVISKTLLSSKDGKPSSVDGSNKVKHIREGIKSEVKRPNSPSRPLTQISGSSNSKSTSGVNIPEFIVLYTEEQLKDHPNLADRAAKYLPDTNEVYINMLYEPMQLMKTLLKKEFASKSTNQEEVDEAILTVLEDTFKLKVGTAVVFALSKKNKDGWEYEEAEDAWSPETLSIVADFWQDDLQDARGKLNKVFKRLSA